MNETDMENEILERERILLGDDGVRALRGARVLVFGVGGVGSYAVEALARAGVGRIDLCDADTVSVSNINRQLVAELGTVGQKKVDAERARILAVNPACAVTVYDFFYLPETAERIDVSGYDYILDCIDTVSAKLDIITRAVRAGVPVISAMGCGNKLRPELLTVSDISKTTTCPLARVMRTELRRRGILHLPVVYSTEPPAEHKCPAPAGEHGKAVPGSVSFVPSVAGLFMAGVVIRAIAEAE